MFFKYFSRHFFSRTFKDSPVYSSTFQACANPVILTLFIKVKFFTTSVVFEQMFQFRLNLITLQQKFSSNMVIVKRVNCTVSHFSYAPLFQGPHMLTKMLESNILYDNLFIDILSV